MRYPGGLIASSPVNAAYPSGVWTQAQTQPYAAQNVWMRDQFWPNTTLLLQGNGTNGAQNNTFLDSSTNNFTITRNGNTTQGSFTPYEANGYWSNFFDGNGDFLSIADNAAFTLGSGDWTIEAWVFTGASATQKVVAGQIDSGGTTLSLSFQLDMSSTDYPRVIIASGTTLYIATSSSTLPKNQWVHLAGVRDGNTMRIYVNGVQTGTQGVTGVTVNDSSSNVGIGRHGQYAGLDWDGYISNLRLVKGTCVYPSGTTFIPSAAPLTAITNTSLLTCQSNRFIDNSTNAFALTVSGTPSVQAFQPFPGATTWSGSVLGGSGYFDGTGDYLTAPDNAALNFGTGNFCIECFFYPTTISGTQGIAAKYAGGDGNRGFNFEMSSGVISCYVYSGGGSTFDTIAGGTAIANAWNHIVLCRSGTTLSAFLNGVRTGTSSNSYNITSVVPVAIGANVSTTGASPFFGYIASTRIVKGSTPYDPTSSTLTVPTAPVTAITNTSLLCNFTNAGIFDSAMMNNLETVGNAQVSTSVVKYGTGSMAFDGSGDYLTLHNVLTSNLGSGPFTVELWVYFNSASGTQFILSNYQSVTVGWGLGIASGNFAFWATGDAPDISTSVAAATGVWYHLAVSGQSGAIRLFLNGTQIGSTFTGTPALNSTATLRIGDGQGAASPLPFNGYIDDLRITKGAARYIGNFTPPVARMPQQ
jgi:hypothetical protein